MHAHDNTPLADVTSLRLQIAAVVHEAVYVKHAPGVMLQVPTAITEKWG